MSQFTGRQVRALMAVGFRPIAGHLLDATALALELQRTVGELLGGENLACSDSAGNPSVELWATANRSNYWVRADVWLHFAAPRAVDESALRLALGRALQRSGAARRTVVSGGVERDETSAASFADAARLAAVGADDARGVGAVDWPVTLDGAWTLVDGGGAPSASTCRPAREAAPATRAPSTPSTPSHPARRPNEPSGATGDAAADEGGAGGGPAPSRMVPGLLLAAGLVFLAGAAAVVWSGHRRTAPEAGRTLPGR